jgi:PAS domain S-box-containing protein
MDDRLLASLLAEQTPLALIATDADGAVSYWNAAAEGLYGFGADEVRGRALSALFDADAADAAALPAGARETVRRRKDGSLIYVHALTTPLVGAQGEPLGHLHCEADMTLARVRRQAQLIEARYQVLLESMPDAIVIVNGIGRIIHANGQAQAMFGHAPQALLGEPIERLMPVRYRRAHVGHRDGYLALSRTRPMGLGLELRGLRANGEEFPVEISLSPLDTEAGRVGLSAIRDISERHRAEQALQDKNLELERANRAKDSFLATMSHELRTPLNGIIGFTGLLLMRLTGPLTAGQERQLGLVQSSARHLLSLINDLLDVARIDSGNVRVHPERVDCRPLLEELLATLRPSAEAKHLGLALQMPTQGLVLQTDRRALQQILINLAGNAIKFTDAGSVTLTAEWDPTPGAREARFTVADTGVGISEQDQARLFRAFAQVGLAPERTRAEGTGLGLYLCRKLAELLGGRLELESAPGQGSRFTLSLPGGPEAP